jgi:carbon monoxide dehydrogenase subunit G
MQLASQQSLPVSQAAAWAALNDTEILKACIPGCESITETEPNHYDVAMTAAVGPVKAKFKGKLKLSDMNPPQSYVINFEGQGGAAGHGKGKAEVRLEPKGDAETLLQYTATASVGGKIAQIGSRLVDMAAQKMAGEFFSKFDAALRERHPATPAPADADARSDAPEGEDKPGWMRRVFKRG